LANRTPEQDLIDRFVQSKSASGTNWLFTNCRSKTQADLEFITKEGAYWVIEAKSHDSKDAHNTVHKIFGELLKETGRPRDIHEIQYGVLLPYEGLSFYSRLFRSIPRSKFVGFGQLIPISAVFSCSVAAAVSEMSWEDLYDFANDAQQCTPAAVLPPLRYGKTAAEFWR
jgi:hypothetical protein